MVIGRRAKDHRSRVQARLCNLTSSNAVHYNNNIVVERVHLDAVVALNTNKTNNTFHPPSLYVLNANQAPCYRTTKIGNQIMRHRHCYHHRNKIQCQALGCHVCYRRLPHVPPRQNEQPPARRCCSLCCVNINSECVETKHRQPNV